jgi:hypothetical protein
VDSILEAYVIYVFDTEANKSAPDLFMSLLTMWLAVIKENDEKTTLSWLRYSYFLFGVISKSMALNLQLNKLLSDDFNRTKRFKEELYSSLSLLINSFAELVVQSHRMPNLGGEIPKFNLQLAYFFSDLLHLADRGFVFGLVRRAPALMSGPKNADKSLCSCFPFRFIRTTSD